MPKIPSEKKPKTACSKSASLPRLHFWTKGMVEIIMESPKGSRKGKVKGETAGGILAVHQFYGGERGNLWSLTSLTAGARIVAFAGLDDAKAVGEVLLSDPSCREALACDTTDGILAALPKWVKPWARACHDAGKHVDPSPFKLMAGVAGHVDAVVAAASARKVDGFLAKQVALGRPS
jgi:hypothetical protein